MNRFIKTFLLSRRIAKHQANLARQCVLGKGFNAAPWQRKDAILHFSVGNLSGITERVTVGDFCNLNAAIHCETKGQVHIGDHVFMNAKTTIRCDHEIRIGNCCMFGPNVKLWDTKNHPSSVSARERQAREICQKKVDSYEAGGDPIIIEDNVWLGMDVIVLAGVTIGHGSIIGAGSIVTRDIPPMTFAAGIPAKPISNVPA